MGKRSTATKALVKPGKTSQKTKMAYSDISEDDIDKFHHQREKILLDESDPGSEDDDGFGQEALMDLPSGSDAYSEDDVLYGGEEEGEAQDEKWGRSKKVFYAADAGVVDEEAAEARKLQKKRLAGMKADDFTGGSRVSSARRAGPVTLDLSDASASECDNESESESFDEPGEFELSEEQVATLSAEEKEALLAQHSADFAALLKDFKERLAYLEGTLQPLLAQLKDLPTSEGLSFLQVKYQLLTAYCTNVAFYLRLKLSGKRVEGHPVLGKLVRFRLLLEKLRPMEQKLRYQVDRLLKAAAGHADDTDDATRFKPNASAFVPALEGEESEAEADRGVYRAPKLAPVHYAEDDASRQDKHAAYLRKVNASTRLIQDIRAEFEDAPEEEALDVVHGGHRKPGRAEAADRDRYEEENYMRFTLDKKSRRKLEARNKVVDELDDLNDFIGELGGGKGKQNKRARRDVQQPLAVAEKPAPRFTPEDESDIEDDYYQKVKSAKLAKKSQGARPDQRGPVKFRPQVDLGDREAARPANWKMLKNKGLTPSRPKDTKNPRVRQRAKFERAEKRLGSFRAVNKGQSGRYAGEGSGIRSNLVRSTKF